jgi:UDP-N-acetylmuramoyl-tripeptide--D-alanyl-D-alanine ligase
MITLDAERAGRALGVGPLAAPVIDVSIDSRTVKPGDLFIAIKGERFDGHDFVQAALAAGASGAVVERAAWAARAESDASGGRSVATAEPPVAAYAQSGAAPIYQVDDTLEALWALAREVRRASGVTVFAITGSVGKTSTKDLLKVMIARVRTVVATAGNQNNEVGVPLTLLSIGPETEAVIVEMGMRGRGQIADLARSAEPDVGIITNVHPVHLELLGTIEGIAEAKAELVAGLRPGGVAVVPAECGPLRPHMERAACRVVRFGVGRQAGEADVRGWLEERDGDAGQSWVLQWPEGEVGVETPYMSEHQVENAVAAVAACYAAGLPVKECAEGVVDVEYSSGRGQTCCVGGLFIIDDTYNANPAAVRAALDELARTAAKRGGRAVAILGDMLELGPDAERFHEEAGAYAATVGVRALWGVGPLSRATVKGFRRQWEQTGESGVEWSAGHVPSSEETSSVMAGLRPGDVILFKASRSMRLEKMAARVTAEAQMGRGRESGA